MHCPNQCSGINILTPPIINRDNHCSIKTLNTQHVDELVRALVPDHLRRHDKFGVSHAQEPQVRGHWLRAVIGQVIVAPDQLALELDEAQIEACKADGELRRPNDQQIDGAIPTCLYQPQVERGGWRMF